MTDTFDRLKAALADRYAIERELGAGGMATVYLAEDLKLHRKVAVKVLRPELAAALGPERFLREIEIAAKLHHPHILALHDSGEADGFLYYVMPYVEGESLRDRLHREKQLPVEDALQIAREVADALGSAHRHDVIHRDIKPENILLEEGHAVVADFGIARAIHAAGGEKLTETGLAVGTPAYMSPEQAMGSQELDGRSDLYSLGCVLYEMLGGEPPFTGATVESIVHQQIAVEPRPVTALRPAVPAEVVAALSRVLSKAPADRFSPARQFAEALERQVVPQTASTTATGATGSRRWYTVGAVALAVILGVWLGVRTLGSGDASSDMPRIVVLPLDNLSGAEEDYFADGMTEEITSRLAGISGLLVISRQTAIQYKGSTKTSREIAEELDVDYVLEGTVRTDRTLDGGGQVRITPQLIRASDDTHLWSDIYTADLVPGEIFSIQTQIAERITESMDIVLLESEEAFAARPTNNQEAYDYYLRGLSYSTRASTLRRIEDVRLAVEMFQRAIALDSNYVDAYVALAVSQGSLFGENAQLTAGPLAKAAVDRVTELLPPNHTTSLRAQANYHQRVTHRHDLAEQYLTAALRVSPNSASLLFDLANLQKQLGRHEEALTTYQEGLDLDPRYQGGDQWLGRIYYEMRRYTEAEIHLDRDVARRPDSHWGHFFKTMLYLSWEGKTERAQRAFDAAFERTDLLRFLLVNWDFDDAMVLRIFADDLADALQRRALGSSPDDSAAYYLAKADASVNNGRPSVGRTYSDSARVVLEGRFELRPDNNRNNSSLGLAYAGLRRFDDAKRVGERAVDLSAGSQFASFVGPRLARIYVLTGDYDAAIDRLEQVLSVPSIISVPLLRFDPVWDPLRDNPRFEELLAKYEN